MSATGAAGDVPVVAAFDYDGTLTRRDTMLPFLASVAGWRRLVRGLAAASPQLGDRSAAKVTVFERTIGGRSYDELVTRGESFATKVVASQLRSEMVERVRWHAAQGHRLVIISASPVVSVAPAARVLGFDDVIATELEVDDEQRATGRLLGANVRGAEKLRRLRALLGEDPFTLWAYGNSSGDAQLLAAADREHYVGRRGWRRRPLTPLP